MFRNYLAAALRNLVRNRLYAVINILGLAVAFAAALIIGLYVREERSFERWIPGYQDVYRLSFGLILPGQGPDPWEYTPGHVGPWFKLDFPQVQQVARLTHPHADARVSLRRGEVEGAELVYWADPALAEVLPLPVVAGDLAAALKTPDDVVLTRRMARKYFGNSDPIGQTIEIDRQHLMTVGAVLEDLPPNTHLAAEIIGSGLATFSELARIDASPRPQIGETFTYIRLAPRASADKITQALPEFLDRRLPPPRGAPVRTAHEVSTLELRPIADIHLHPAGLGAMKPAGDVEMLQALTAIAVLLVLAAGINFVNLMTARSSRRAVEVGVRKVMGAGRVHLITQFLGESGIYAGLAIMAAVCLAGGALPGLTGVLGRNVDFGRLFDPLTLGAAGALALLVGLLAGAYPAFVLSAFRPSRVFRILQRAAGGAGILRQGLVTVQFAVLIALVLATAVIYAQTTFAVNEGLRFRQDQVVIVETSCATALSEELRKVPGVLGAACAGGSLAGFDSGGIMGTRPDGTQLSYLTDYVDFDFFRLYGISPVAGRLFEQGRSIDLPVESKELPGRGAIINESAVRYLGFTSPEAAVGQVLPVMKREIVGVVPDFQMQSVRDPVGPTAYLPGDPVHYRFLSLRIAGDRVPEVLSAVDALWQRIGERQRPISRFFFDQYLNDLYAEMVRQGDLLTALAAVAIMIAVLGLFGLAAFTAERRTKEIGIRKAMGASSRDMLRLLVWEFVQPVLWANVIAWPVGYLIMHRWLEDFAYHVTLSPWIFAAVSAVALVIAVLTVAGHALLVARAQPVTALRYE